MDDIETELRRDPPPQTFPPIIGFVGPMGVGKTFLADALCTRVGGTRLSFASPIRDMLVTLGLEPEALSKRKNEPVPWLYDQTPRQLMRSLGTAWGRNLVGPDVWVNAVLRRAQATRYPVVVDDVRFDNEAALLRRAGAMIVLLHRPNVGYAYDHPTEYGLRDWSLLSHIADLTAGSVHQAQDVPDLIPRRPWWAALPIPVRKMLRIKTVRTYDQSLSCSLAPAERTADRLATTWLD